MTEHISRVISLYGTPDVSIILYVCVPCQSRGRRHRSRSNISDRLHELTLEQKLYVVQREVTETQQDREKLKQKHQRIQDNYKVTTHPSTEIQIQLTKENQANRLLQHIFSLQASLKEAELRLAEIRKAKSVFERRVLKHMKDHRLEMREPENVFQYMEDKSKVKTSANDTQTDSRFSRM